MKLLRWGAAGQERPGLLDNTGKIRDLSGVIDDIDGKAVTAEGLARLSGVDASGLPEVPAGTRLGPCIGNVGKFICIGLNYADHAAESNLPIPTEPVVFCEDGSSYVSGRGTLAPLSPNEDAVRSYFTHLQEAFVLKERFVLMQVAPM